MACNCIQDIEKVLLEDAKAVIEASGKLKVRVLTLSYVSFPYSAAGLGIRTNQPYEIELEGKTRTLKRMVAHNFCPWCGVAYSGVDAPEKQPVENAG